MNLDIEKIQEDQKYDGYYCLRNNTEQIYQFKRSY